MYVFLAHWFLTYVNTSQNGSNNASGGKSGKSTKRPPAKKRKCKTDDEEEDEGGVDATLDEASKTTERILSSYIGVREYQLLFISCVKERKLYFTLIFFLKILKISDFGVELGNSLAW